MRPDTSITPPMVLLVEDEPLVRMTAADELDEAGFQVLEAKNADEALALLEAHSDEVQVLFTDVDMPGSMDGMALAERGLPALAACAAADLLRPCPSAS